MKRNKVSGLKSHTGYWLRFVSNYVSHSFARKLAGTGVTVAEWVVLREMYEIGGETSPSAIAKITGLSRGAISKLVERLLQKSLVVREGSTTDRRYQNVRLTNDARSLVPELAALADKNDEEFFGGLTDNERKDLVALLQKIVKEKNLSKVPIN
jgi:DNA-binding MarR family transcriptional regulator